MQYRTLGKGRTKVSILGFGGMRLPTKGTDADVDEAESIRMIRYAIDQGVNYVDTAYVYHGGKSETVIGRVLADGYRRKVSLATKMPVWMAEKSEDFDRLFNEQLARLRTDKIDFYLVHCLQKDSWAKMRNLGILEWAERKKREGRIGELGFSFHDTYEVFTGIVDAYDWSFCQIQYNLVNENVQAGTKGLKYAAAKGLGVIIMEPLFGGTLANPPPPIKAIWERAGADYKPVDMALRWLWNKPEISVVLSGMSTFEQTQQNIVSASRAGGVWLNETDKALLLDVQANYEKLSPVPCTKCRYCMPCPHGVDIPLNFEYYNNLSVFQGNTASLCKILYQNQPELQRASACKKCRICEQKCPQQILISEKLGKVAAAFA